MEPLKCEWGLILIKETGLIVLIIPLRYFSYITFIISPLLII